MLLLGYEYRNTKSSAHNGSYWLHFGGKREKEESDPAHTAAREFHEETGGLFANNTAAILEKLKANDITKLWCVVHT